MGGWLRSWGDVALISVGNSAPQKKEFFKNGTFPFIRTSDVGKIKKGSIKCCVDYLNEDAVKNSSTNIIPKGNVVIATRVGLGKSCLLKNDTAINQDLKGVTPINNKILSVGFLFIWFKSVSNKIINEGTGATVQRVKLTFIKSLLIPLPPLKEQQAIVKKLDALSAETKKLETIYQQKINDLNELKKSILQQAFNGII